MRVTHATVEEASQKGTGYVTGEREREREERRERATVCTPPATHFFLALDFSASRSSKYISLEVPAASTSRWTKCSKC